MVDNLLQIFEKATERFLDQISSSDEEIAVEFQETSRDSKAHSSSSSSQVGSVKQSKIVSQPVGQKRKSVPPTKKSEKRQSLDRSPSVASSKKSEPPVTEKVKNKKTHGKPNTKTAKTIKKETKKTKGNVKSNKSKSPCSIERDSPLPPTPSPENSPESESEYEHVSKMKEKRKHWKEIFKEKKMKKKSDETEVKHAEENKSKEKNSKLRETIEKLKEKNNLKDDFPLKSKKEDKDKQNIEPEEKKNDKNVKKSSLNQKSKLKAQPKEQTKVVSKKCEFDFKEELSDKEDISNKKVVKKPPRKAATMKNVADIDALEAATEQTLKDINKWLDDTPRFSEFSSASNSPSHCIGIEETDIPGIKTEQEYRKNLKIDKLASQRGKDGQKELLFKRRLTQLKDSAKIPRRREVQRTIDRLQPGKSKGNLLSNIQNTSKLEEMFSLGPLSKLRDTKHALVTKTDDATPKLSLGKVLDSFGQHNFSKDVEKIEPEISSPKSELPVEATNELKEETSEVKTEALANKKQTDLEKPEADAPKKEAKSASVTPNLSAWFKAFGAPKVQQTQKKKPESELDVKEPEVVVSNPEPKTASDVKEDVRKVSPEPDSPMGQPTRQRRGSTGSSISERSSFSQDMDSSPRMTMDERIGAYPAPYPSPLHRSPVSASPVMASPRQEDASRTPYPALNGSIRVGFYQDTVSTKSSPDKSCSPRDQPRSPYQQYPEHIYTQPNTVQQGSNYPYTTTSYYSQQPTTYATTNTSPVYLEERSNFYDTAKSLTDQYNTKSPASTSTQNEIVDNDDINEYDKDNIDNMESQFRQRTLEKPSAVFPVKKRLYNENETNPSQEKVQLQDSQDSAFTNKSLEQGLMTGGQLNLDSQSQELPSEIQNISSREKQFTQEIQENETDQNYSQAENRNFNLLNKTLDNIKMFKQDVQQNQNIQNISPNIRMNFSQNPQDILQNTFESLRNVENNQREENVDENKFDMKLGMGYLNTGNVDVRTTQYQSYSKSASTDVSNPQVVTQHSGSSSGSENLSNLTMRYPDSRLNHSIPYPARNEPQNVPVSRTDILQMNETSRVTEGMPNRNMGVDMSGATFKPEIAIPRPSFSSSSALGIDQSLMRGNLANIPHIVDRFPSDERLLSGIQNSSFYADKGLSHMFGKSMPTTLTSNACTSSLTMFTQQMAYRNEQIQQSASNVTYSRPVTELQNPQPIIPQSKSPVSQIDVKKANKKRKTKIAEVHANATPQGFQSYSGLKNTVSGDPSTISLKTANVVPGSAFNFGPTGTGLGLPSWGVAPSEKDAYQGFLDEYRSQPNYFLTRSAPENTSKETVRQAHQQNAAASPSFPFIGHPQPRAPGYSLGNPFMNPHQASLMDPNSPLYQQYLHSAGVLHQGLLGSTAGYPAGYHPALSMRQPFEPMNRPWL